MSCYHPQKAYVTGTTKNGKPKYTIIDYKKPKNLNLKEYMEYREKFEKNGFVEVPCGKCIGCLMDKSRDWANRLLLESLDHEFSYFVTLTYDDAHIPVSTYSDENGEFAGVSQTLRKRDVQLFMKRLRYYVGQKIRYYAAGEYGSDTFRPHYHLILFGFELTDLKPLQRTKQGFHLYTSEFLERVWSDEDFVKLGHVAVGEFSWESAAYVARYVTKKQYGESGKAAYEAFNMEPPFALMSRNPGIGRNYYTEHPDLFQYEKIEIQTGNGGKSIKPPRYFERLFSEDHPEEYEEMKRRRREAAEETKNIKLSLTDNDYLSILSIDENVKKRQVERLRRNLI